MQGIWDYKYQYRFDLRTPQPNAASMGREFATSDPVGCSPSFRLPPHLRGRYRTLQIAGSGKSEGVWRSRNGVEQQRDASVAAAGAAEHDS